MMQALTYEELNLENIQLRNEILRLQQKLDALSSAFTVRGKHHKLTKGLEGETLVASILNGIVTGQTESFDVQLPERQITIEVKSACLNLACKGTTTKRWNWARPFGERGGKVYDRLVLVGDADPEYKHLYKDPASPFVVFDIPYDEIMPLTIKSNNYRSIQLTTNPKTARGTSSPLFTQYQVTLVELQNRYGL